MMKSIFVFGANEAGIHGAGAAREACHRHGAIWGQYGAMNNCYGIPTKDKNIQTLPLKSIKDHVDDFIIYAMIHKECFFLITPIGCGLAGYTADDIGPMFRNTPSNCSLPVDFIKWKI